MASPFDTFLKLLGGEANLPRKLTPPPPSPPPPPPTAQPATDDVYQSEEYQSLPPSTGPDSSTNSPLTPTHSRPLSHVNLVNPVFMPLGGTFAFDEKKGEPAPVGLSFCPFIAVTKYCYKFAPRNWSQPLATAFFDSDKIYARDWHLYYVATEYGGVVTFVTESQLRFFLDHINTQFPDADLAIDDWSRNQGLVLNFDDSTFRPRYLGQITSRAQFRSWTDQLSQEPMMVLPSSSDRSLDAFKANMDAALEASKNKTKARNGAKKQQAVVQRQQMVKQHFRAQRYLGFLPKEDADPLLAGVSALSISVADPDKPAPYAFEQEPIFISIDVEAYELPPRMVTEVGVATLDTRDLKGVAPGENGTGWHKFIRGRHFRMIEFKHLKNQQYVQGCPDEFEFGESEFIAKDSIGSVLATCFKPPYSDPTASGTDMPATAEPRNLIIVGHDLAQDIAYCEKVGFAVFNRGNIIDTMDTLNMWRTYCKDATARSSLGTILYECDLTGWHLHNAGNDAVYTVQAMLAICVKEATERDSKEASEKREQQAEKKIENLVEAARERAKDDMQGWELDGGDGGAPVTPRQTDFKPKAPTAQEQRNAAKQDPGNGLYTMGGVPLDV